jgi:hypothetical protein
MTATQVPKGAHVRLGLVDGDLNVQANARIESDAAP